MNFVRSGIPLAVELPKDAEVLRIDRQYGEFQLWAEVNTDKSMAQRKFVVYGTGTEIDKDLRLKYINTIFVNAFVWHFYEVSP
jgi:hypothetical protein